MKLLIYKTNIKTLRKLKSLRPIFDNHPIIQRWSVDLEDVDRVLKLSIPKEVKERDMLQWLRQKGVHCEALK